MNLDLLGRILQYLCIYIAGIIGAWQAIIPDPTQAEPFRAKDMLRMTLIFLLFTYGSAVTWDGYPESVSFIAFIFYTFPFLCIAGYADRLSKSSSKQS